MAVFRLFTGHDGLPAHMYRNVTEVVRQKKLALWTNIICVPIEFSTEIRNHPDIGKREDLSDNNLRLFYELFDVIVAVVSLFNFFLLQFLDIVPVIGNNKNNNSNVYVKQ